MALLNDDEISRQPLIERLDNLPDDLTIIEIAMLYCGDPFDPPYNDYGLIERWHCSERVYNRALLLIKTLCDESKVIPDLFEEHLRPTHGVTFIVTRFNGSISSAPKLERECEELGYKINKKKFKLHLQNKNDWPLKPENMLAAWWTDDELEVKIIRNYETNKIKPRNKQRDNDALILLHAALDKIEDRTGKTPSSSELLAFVLSGEFKHSNIEDYDIEKNGSLINNRILLLTDGTKLDKAKIIRRYRETIYK